MSEQAYIGQLLKKYPDFLRRIITRESFETIALRGLKRPEKTESLWSLIAIFQKYEKSADRAGWTIAWESWKSRKLSQQRWPSSITITTEEDFISLIGKTKETAEFRSQVKQLIAWNNRIVDWLQNHVSAVLKYKSVWKDVCAVMDFFLLEDATPYYIRNIPIPVHTKFIDQHSSLILAILKSLDPERFPPDVNDLEKAAGLRKKPHLYSMRWLDLSLAEKYTAGLDVLGLPFTRLQNVNWKVPEVWLVENETNLYLLPERKNALALFAKGYALHNLKAIPFFKEAHIFYWGDLDEDGYLMLEQFRYFYPHTISVLMDESTVLFHIEQIKIISYRYNRPQLNLRPAELAGYLFLLEKHGRIEQEKLRQDFVQLRINDTYTAAKMGADPPL
jgi:hypothetical protein